MRKGPPPYAGMGPTGWLIRPCTLHRVRDDGTVQLTDARSAVRAARGRSADHPDRMSPARRHAVVYNAISWRDRPHTVDTDWQCAGADVVLLPGARSPAQLTDEVASTTTTRDPATGRSHGVNDS